LSSTGWGLLQKTCAAGQGCKAASSRAHNVLPKHQLRFHPVVTASSRNAILRSTVHRVLYLLLARNATCSRSQCSANNTTWLGFQHVFPKVTVCSETPAAGQGCNMWPRKLTLFRQSTTWLGSNQVPPKVTLASRGHNVLQNTSWLGSQRVPPELKVCSRKHLCWPGVQHAASPGHSVLPNHHLARVTTCSSRGHNIFLQRFQLASETLASSQGCKAMAS
jgi:hypothetical protein